MVISIKPTKPNDLKLTAHGYRKITSTSNKTNNMATKKYLIEYGTRAFPSDSMPHSKLKSLTEPARFGPKTDIMARVKATKAAATPNCIKMGKKSNAVYVGFIKKGVL